MTNDNAANISPLSIELEDGSAEYMGGGMYVVHQRDETAQEGQEAQSIALSTQDLEAIGAVQDLTVPLEDGVAERTDADLWCILQRDHEAQAAQSVVLSRQDLGVMLAAA